MALSIIPRGEIANQDDFDRFGCKTPVVNPETPDRLKPDVTVEREFSDAVRLTMPDGREVRMWTLHDPKMKEPVFPSPTMRFRQGQIVHSTIHSKKNTHTIHHHGMEPTAFNDGVGHTSFEVSGRYTYQFRPHQAGTYFYHCHKNTVLHFEMGMYGLLIVDPPEGEGHLHRTSPGHSVEAAWVADEIDHRWRGLNHSEGIKCPFDDKRRILNTFRPGYFLITGVPAPLTETDPRVAVKCVAGQTVLLRILNAGYTVHHWTIEGLDATVNSVDGFPLEEPYSEPLLIPAGTPFQLTTAQRFNALVTPKKPGTYRARVEFLDWITRKKLGEATTFIEAS